VANESKRTGLSLPTGILQPTTPPDPARPPAGQGGAAPAADGADEPDAPAGAKAPKGRKAPRKAAGAGPEKDDGAKLYLSEDVRFRLRMLAFQRGKKISTVANEVLDRHLPRWKLERTE
jgi:hypothetical protein